MYRFRTTEIYKYSIGALECGDRLTNRKILFGTVTDIRLIDRQCANIPASALGMSLPYFYKTNYHLNHCIN